MKVLVTGGTGFLGEALVKRLIDQGENVRVVARNEGKLVSLKQQYPQIEILTGSISDEWVATKAMQGVDGVFHLAAVKNVEIAEKEVFNTINTNITGTLNLLRESIFEKPKFFLAISTDKAAQVSGVYGASKMIMERLIGETAGMNKDTRYRIVRYGNVLYSTGSVLCKWKEKMQKGEPIMITDPEMTRFFWTREEAIDLIFQCLKEANDSTPFVPVMKAMKIGELVEAMMQKYGQVPVQIIGNRGGENMHETMDGKVFSNQVEQFTKEEIKEKI